MNTFSLPPTLKLRRTKKLRSTSKLFLLVNRTLGVGLFIFVIFGTVFCNNEEIQNKSYNIYFAGDLFDQKHLTGNYMLARQIEKLSDGKYKCFLPQDWEAKYNSSVDIRNRDLEAVIHSDLAIFNFDGTALDPGTVVEFMAAKALDIPCVLLRTDFRNGGRLFGADWNLMLYGFPRCKIIKHSSIMLYNNLGMEGMHTKIAKSVIDAFEEIIQIKSLFNSREESVFAYTHFVKMCGGGFDNIMSDETINKIIDEKIEKDIYNLEKEQQL